MSEKAIVSGILGIFLLVSALGLSPVPGPYGDNARYIILAKSLIQGKGMAKINFPDESPEKKIPPVYPLVLASLILLFGYNMLILKASSMVFMALALILFYVLMKMIKISLAQRVIVFGLLAASSINIEYSREVLSESLFVLFICAITLLISLYEKENRNKFLLAGLSLAVPAFFLRDAAMIALAAIAIILLRKRSMGFFWTAVALVLALGYSWVYKNSFTETGYLREIVREGSYLDPAPGQNLISLPTFLRRYCYEAAAYAGDVLPDFVLPVFKNIRPHSPFWPVKLLSAAGILFWAVRGAYRLWKIQGMRFFLIFPALYAICLPLFPSYGTRYLVPVGFFIILFWVCGMSGIRLLQKKQVAAGLLCCAVLANAVPAATDIIAIRKGYSGQWGNYYRALYYLKQNAESSSVIICRKPFLGYLLSERKTLGYRYGAGVEEIFAEIMNSPARYVIVDGLNIGGIDFSRKYLGSVIEAHKDSFVLVYKIEGPLTEVYEIKR